MRIVVALLLQHIHILCSTRCPTPPTSLVVAKKGVYCSASSSFHNMPCQYAWDGDPNTIWHPTGSGEGAYTTLHLNEAILVTGVVVEQYSWSSGFAAQLGIMLNSSDWIEVRVFDSKKKTIWEDTEAHETKLVTVFIKEVGPFRGSAFGGMVDITLRGCPLAKGLEVAQVSGKSKKDDSIQNLPPPSAKVEAELGAVSNIFGFSSAATSDLKDTKTLTAGGVGLLPGLLVGAGVLVGLLCMSAFFYALHTRRSHRWHISEEERVSFSPSRQGGSEEEVYDRVTPEEQ